MAGDRDCFAGAAAGEALDGPEAVVGVVDAGVPAAGDGLAVKDMLKKSSGEMFCLTAFFGSLGATDPGVAALGAASSSLRFPFACGRRADTSCAHMEGHRARAAT